jgi:heme-degrading monooxygenase HmoA
MSELVTTGIWVVKTGEEASFVEEWTRFAEWASKQPGATTLRLGRVTINPSKFVSFAAWADEASVRAWKSQPDFTAHMARVRRHVAEFEPTELDVVAHVPTVATMATAAEG